MFEHAAGDLVDRHGAAWVAPVVAPAVQFAVANLGVSYLIDAVKKGYELGRGRLPLRAPFRYYKTRAPSVARAVASVGSRSMPTFSRGRYVSRRGRFGRRRVYRRRVARRSFRRVKRSFRRGRRRIGRKGAVDFTRPLRRRVRERRNDYTPPMGRLGGGLGMQAWERVKITRVGTYQMNGTSSVQQFKFPFYLSDCHSVDAVRPLSTATIPSNPDFYRVAANWEQFKYTGMKVEMFALPTLVGANTTGITFQHTGRAYSRVNIAESPMLQTPVSMGVTAPSNVESASRDPSFQYANLEVNISTDFARSGKGRRPFWKRYMPVTDVTQNVSVAASASLNYNHILDVNPTLGVPNTVEFVQPDHRLEYTADRVQIISGITIFWEFKQTFYLYFKNRRTDQEPVGAYQDRVEVAAVAFNTAPATNPDLLVDREP